MEEPEGWRELQQEALNETHPQRLVEIIDQLLSLLTAHENKVAQAGTRTRAPERETSADNNP
jgi:hypothetical protein